VSLPRYPKYKDSGVEWLGEVPEHWQLDERCRPRTLEPAFRANHPLTYGVWSPQRGQSTLLHLVGGDFSGPRMFKYAPPLLAKYF
jgi:hypothetical protein